MFITMTTFGGAQITIREKDFLRLSIRNNSFYIKVVDSDEEYEVEETEFNRIKNLLIQGESNGRST